MILLDDKDFGGTIIARNVDIRGNILTEIRELVLPSQQIDTHVGDKKIRIYSRKTEMATNITINKMTENIESNTILEFTDAEGEIHQLINIKYS